MLAKAGEEEEEARRATITHTRQAEGEKKIASSGISSADSLGPEHTHT